MIKKLLRHRTLCRFIGILLALALLSVMFLWLYAEFEKAALHSLSQLSREFVDQVGTISGTLTNIIEHSAMQIFYSSSIKTLRSKPEMTNAELIRGMRELGTFVSSSEFLDSAAVYNSETELLYGSQGRYAPTVKAKFYDPEGADLLVTAGERPYMIPNKRMYGDEWYYSFLFAERTNDSSGALLLNVRAKWYESQLLGIASGDNCVILDQDGSVLVSGNPILSQSALDIWPKIQQHSAMQMDDGLIVGKSHSDELSWMYYRMEDSGWYYLKSFRLDQMTAGMIRIRNFVLSLLLVVVCLIIAVAAYVIVKVYRPFVDLRSKLRRSGQLGDDYNQQMDMLIEDQKTQEAQRKLNLLLDGNKLEDFPQPVSLILVADDRLESLSELMGGAGVNSICAVMDSGCLVALSQVDSEQAITLCGQLVLALGSPCFVGNACGCGPALEQSRQHLIELQKLSYLYPGQQLFAESYLDSCNATFVPKDAAPLAAALKSGQLEDARAAWREIFAAIHHSRYADFVFAMQYLYNMMETLQLELSIDLYPMPNGDYDITSGVEQLQTYIDGLLCHITAASRDIKDKRLMGLAKQVQYRIDAGFADGEMSLQHIADEMGMNAVYLGRLFRQSTGHSVNDALNAARITKAKDLLRTTTDTVEQIAGQVGFSNIKYFFVIFKSGTGVTPRQYRLSAPGELAVGDVSAK